MKLEWFNGVASLFAEYGLWNLFVGISLQHQCASEPVMSIYHFANRSQDFSVTRCLSAGINLLGVFVRVSVGKVGVRT